MREVDCALCGKPVDPKYAVPEWTWWEQSDSHQTSPREPTGRYAHRTCLLEAETAERWNLPRSEK